MYNSSVDFVVKSIQKIPLVNLNGFVYQEYQNFFDNFWLEKILKEYQSYTFDLLENQEKTLRKKLSYESKLSKELNILFSNTKIKNTLEQVYEIKLKFLNCDLWQDSQGYMLNPHLDDNRIKLSLQIYLGELPDSGTKFFSPTVAKISKRNLWKKEYLQHEIKEIVYKKNHGYSMLNNSNAWHGVSPSFNDKRLSVYIRYH